MRRVVGVADDCPCLERECGGDMKRLQGENGMRGEIFADQSAKKQFDLPIPQKRISRFPHTCTIVLRIIIVLALVTITSIYSTKLSMNGFKDSSTQHRGQILAQKSPLPPAPYSLCRCWRRRNLETDHLNLVKVFVYASLVNHHDFLNIMTCANDMVAFTIAPSGSYGQVT